MDLELQRKNRTSQQRAANRLVRFLTLMQANEAETPWNISLQIIQEKEVDLAAIIRRGARCNTLILNEEVDEELQQQDEAALETFQAATAKGTRLLQNLVVQKTVSCLSTEVEQSMDEVDKLMAEDPTQDYSESFPEISQLLTEINESLRVSTFEADHALRKKALEHKIRLTKLRAIKKEAPRVRESRDHKPTFDELVKLNKITVPPFRGGLENWQSFWVKYKTAVHENPSLQVEHKLLYLQDSIKDPSLEAYMRASSVNRVSYDEVIANLQGRYDKPRELHSIYCHKLAELQPIKGTSAELSQAADTVFAAVTGLLEGGQPTIRHIATSLVAPILPKALRAEWETKTEKTRGVADIFEWIEFMRNKANSVCHEQKAPTVSYKHPSREPKRSEKSHPRSEAKVHVAASQPPAEHHPHPPKEQSAPSKSTPAGCKVPCKLCSNLHYIFSCRQFLCHRGRSTYRLLPCAPTA